MSNVKKQHSGKRCLVRKYGYMPINEFVIEEVSPSGEYFKINTRVASTPVWNRCDEYEIIEVLE